METIPLTNEQTESQDNAILPTIPVGREPLVVEALEDRVLLASDAATESGVAESAPPEPLAYVAAPHVGQLAVDLGDAVAPSEVNSESGKTPSNESGPRPPHPAESHAEAEVVDTKTETVERSPPESIETPDHEPNHNRFGLATIEPELKNSPYDEISSESLIGKSDQQELSETETSRAVTGNAEPPTHAVAVDLAVKEVADGLATLLPPAKQLQPAVEPTLGKSSLAREIPAGEVPTDDQSGAVARSILQAEVEAENSPVTVDTPSAEDTALALADAPAAEQPATTHPSDGAPQAQSEVQQCAVETLAAAHDALFARGNGVEAVLERPSA
jgi:hypothetical protein